MKVKLLKKTRQRFSIIHHPNGINYYDEFFSENLVGLYDADLKHSVNFVQLDYKVGERPFCDKKADSLEEAIIILKNVILKYLKAENLNLGRKKHSAKSNKVWYVK